MVEKYDIIVAGGGPAGLAAAKAAAAEGGKVLLLELQSQIGGQTQSATWIPTDLITPPLEESIVAEVKEVNIHSPHEELSISGDFGSIVDRRLFDKLLATEAIASGTEIWVGYPVRELLMSEDTVKGVYAETGGWAERIESEIVIDATGSRGEWSSLLLKKVLKRDWGQDKLALSNEYLMANVAEAQGVDLYFTAYFAPLGHVWVYPFGKRFAMIGIKGVRIHPDAALDEFIGRRVLPRLEQAVPVGAFRGRLPLEGPLSQTCAKGMISVGEAAGQIYTFSGQGVRYALRCGELAGKVAIDAITEGDVSKEALAEYEREWQTEFGAELKIGQLLHSSLGISQDRRADLLLDALKAESKLQWAFVNVFTGFELKDSLKVLLGDDRIVQIFGRKTVEKVLSLK